MPPSNYFAAQWFATAWLFTETTALAARNRSVLPVTPGSAMCRFECQTRSVFKSGCRPGRRRVLINQTHAYRDLIMPIDSTEKRLFDAIDGNRSIGGIVERTLPSSQTKSQLDMARTFFEKLWWYDQVVFDASRCRARREESLRCRRFRKS